MLEYNGRNILIKINHIGINHEDIRGMVKSQAFLNFKYSLSQQIQYKQVIIGSIDAQHPLSGIKHKLEAYYHFLDSYPVYQKNTCLIQFMVPLEA